MAPIAAKKTIQKRKIPQKPNSAKNGKPLFILAHGAGHAVKGCKHKDVQAWAKALRKLGDVVDTLKYGKPYNLMGNLCAVHSAVVDKALGLKARPVTLVGFGMGARVAMHMMGNTPGDDGKPLPEVPTAVLKSVQSMVAVNYPLLRVGTREVRAGPLLALTKSAPRTLFVAGPKDPHMDVSRLEGIMKKMKSKTELLELPLGMSEKPDSVTDVVQQIASFIR